MRCDRCPATITWAQAGPVLWRLGRLTGIALVDAGQVIVGVEINVDGEHAAALCHRCARDARFGR